MTVFPFGYEPNIILFSSVSSNDKQTPPQFDPTFMKDAQCAETNEKTNFLFLQFLFSELWSILFTICKCSSLNNQLKMANKSEKMRIVQKQIFSS